MSQPAPAGSFCATHNESSAAWTCGRCGAFFCTACERRTRPEATPMCPACWALRGQQVQSPADTTQRLRWVGIVIGALALVPGCWWLQIAAIVVNIAGLVNGRKKQVPREWMNVAGLVAAGVGLVLTVALLVFAAASNR